MEYRYQKTSRTGNGRTAGEDFEGARRTYQATETEEDRKAVLEELKIHISKYWDGYAGNPAKIEKALETIKGEGEVSQEAADRIAAARKFLGTATNDKEREAAIQRLSKHIRTYWDGYDSDKMVEAALAQITGDEKVELPAEERRATKTAKSAAAAPAVSARWKSVLQDKASPRSDENLGRWKSAMPARRDKEPSL